MARKGLRAHRPEPGTSDYIDEDKQSQPDHINEVPIPAGRLEPEVIVAGKMPFLDAKEHHDQNDRTQDHVGTMKPGEHEEGATVNTGLQGQVQVLVGVDVLLGLQAQEDQCQHNGGAKPDFYLFVIVFLERMVGHSDRKR